MNKVVSVLDTILEKFRTGDIPEAVALASFPKSDVPSNKWSFMNRLIVFLGGTCDARGFRQWKETGRRVKKGSKAIYILVPCFDKRIDEETGEEILRLKFFKPAAVFRYEDTLGRPIEHLKLDLPEFPLLERAREWGIAVKAVPGNNSYNGYYDSRHTEIALASPEENVFFHELAHASHERVIGRLKPTQDPFQEIVAELSAMALCRMVGKKPLDTTGNSYRYIERYARGLNMSPYAACLKVLSDTEKVLNLILKGADKPDNKCQGGLINPAGIPVAGG